MADTVPLSPAKCPPSGRNTVRHAAGMVSAIETESCPPWAGTRNYDSANKYMDARLKEIPDDEERNAVQSSYYSAVNSKGEAAVDQVLGRSSKTESCKYAITLIDAGSMNIEDFVKSAKLPIMPNLEELVAWASAH